MIEFGDEFLKGGENVIPKYFEEKKNFNRGPNQIGPRAIQTAHSLTQVQILFPTITLGGRRALSSGFFFTYLPL